MLLAAATAVISYAAWQGNRESNGNLTTGNVAILNIDATVTMTNPGLTLVPFDQSPTSYDHAVSANYLQFSVNVLSAEQAYDLTASVVSGTLADGSELRLTTTAPTALTDGAVLIAGATHNTVTVAVGQAATTEPVSHTFYLHLVSSNLADRNQPINFLITISPTA